MIIINILCVFVSSWYAFMMWENYKIMRDRVSLALVWLNAFAAGFNFFVVCVTL